MHTRSNIQFLRSTVLACISTIILFSSILSAQEIKVGANASWGEPLIFFDDQDMPQKGLVVELTNAILKEAKLKFSWVILPRNRTEEKLFAGEIDLRVYLSPGWTSKPSEHEWSDFIFEDRNVLVQTKSAKKVTSFDQLKSEKIGTVLGYYYPFLNKYFDNGDLTRVNAETQDALLLMLDNEKIDYAITNDFASRYFIKKKSKNKKVSRSEVDFTPFPIHFAARKGETEMIKKINAAIKSLNKSKKIDRIIAKYK